MYVYLLQSLSSPDRRYVGKTADLRRRFDEHNTAKSPHTRKYAPWRIVTTVWFADKAKAEAFELYLKSGSGHAFAKRHVW